MAVLAARVGSPAGSAVEQQLPQAAIQTCPCLDRFEAGLYFSLICEILICSIAQFTLITRIKNLLIVWREMTKLMGEKQLAKTRYC
jgi:hypothetical protein